MDVCTKLHKFWGFLRDHVRLIAVNLIWKFMKVTSQIGHHVHVSKDEYLGGQDEVAVNKLNAP